MLYHPKTKTTNRHPLQLVSSGRQSHLHATVKRHVHSVVVNDAARLGLANALDTPRVIFTNQHFLSSPGEGVGSVGVRAARQGARAEAKTVAGFSEIDINVENDTVIYEVRAMCVVCVCVCV